MLTQKRARQSIINTDDFSELQEIQNNWQVIRDEVTALHQQNLLKNTTDPEESSYYDIGFRTFYKYGWSKFYLIWYGKKLESAQRLCPRTVEILSRIPMVKGAMFSLLPPGSKLTRHLDPVACSLRYHLALSTPNNDACFINVDGTPYSWRDGQVLLFDETYLHFAHNNTDQNRFILMCDIARPMVFFGKWINAIILWAMRLSIVPNMAGDSQGLVNKIFYLLAPLHKASSIP